MTINDLHTVHVDSMGKHAGFLLQRPADVPPLALAQRPIHTSTPPIQRPIHTSTPPTQTNDIHAAVHHATYYPNAPDLGPPLLLKHDVVSLGEHRALNE